MNFRASYLASLGFEREQLAKSEAFDALLVAEQSTSNNVSLVALRKLCIRVGVVSKWRALTWKLLLGVLPPQFATWQFISASLQRQYEDLYMAACVVFPQIREDVIAAREKKKRDEEQHTNLSTPKSKPPMLMSRTSSSSASTLIRRREDELFYVYIIRSVLCQDSIISVDDVPSLATVRQAANHREDEPAIRAIARELCSIFESNGDAFFCLTRFLDIQNLTTSSAKTGKVIQSWGVSHRVRVLTELLQREEPQLHAFFAQQQVNYEEQVKIWFRSYFAESIPSHKRTEVQEIWDRLLCAPADYIVFVGISLLQHLKPRILACTKPSQIVALLKSPQPPNQIDRLFSFLGDRKMSADMSVMPFTMLRSVISVHVRWPVVEFGQKGPLVRILQYFLRQHGLTSLFSLDGYYGIRTTGAVQRFIQKLCDSKLGEGSAENSSTNTNHEENANDGSSDSVNPLDLPGTLSRTFSMTISSISRSVSNPNSHNSSMDLGAMPVLSEGSRQMIRQCNPKRVTGLLWPYLVSSYCTKGSRGDVVRAVQTALSSFHNYSVRVDGVFGQNCLEAVCDFQTKHSAACAVDGVVGPITWLHLIGVNESEDDA